MQSILGITLIILVSLASHLALYALLSALFSERVEAIREILQFSRGRSFWLGLVNSLFVFALAAVFLGISENTGLPIFALLTVLTLAFYAVGLAFGLSGLSQLVGQRLFPAREPLPAQLRGGLVMALAALTPYVGWFLVLPYLLLVSFGAFVSLLFQSWRQR